MSGQQTYNCFSDKKPNLRRICIDSMSDRAFNVYTEFYSHTQNMCFYLYNKIWHEKAEETINLLNSNTQYVNEQLELAKNLQANLLEQQQRGLEIQDILMRQGKKLSSELEISHNYVQNIAQNFTTSTKEHSNLLFDIISKINYIQKWVLGEMTWMSSFCYYVAYLIGILVLSSTEKTQSCRFQLLLIFLLNIVLEYIGINQLSYYIISPATFQSYVLFYKTVLRCFSLFTSVLVYAKHILYYKNYNKDNNHLIIELQKQMSEMVQCLNEMRMNNLILLSLLKQISLDQYSAANYKNFPECLEKIDHKINPTNLIYKTDEDENTVAFTDHNNYNETTEDNSLTTCKLKLRNRKIIMENNTNRTPRLRAKVAKATKA